MMSAYLYRVSPRQFFFYFLEHQSNIIPILLSDLHILEMLFTLPSPEIPLSLFRYGNQKWLSRLIDNRTVVNKHDLAWRGKDLIYIKINVERTDRNQKLLPKF